MFLNLFKKKKEISYISEQEANTYWVENYKKSDTSDDRYGTVRITADESHCDRKKLLFFAYSFICKLAENNNLCYYVEYDENLPEHKEVIAHLQKNFENGDVYSIIYSASAPLLAIRQSKPTVEIMAKAGKDGFNYASGVLAFIYKGVPEFNKQKEHNAVELLGVEKQYFISAYVNDSLARMVIDFDKTQISFDEIVKVAEETANQCGVYLEVFK